MKKTLGMLTLLGVLLAGAVRATAADRPGTPDPATSDTSLERTGMRAGTISGVVTVESSPRPRRRTADRGYSGAPSGAKVIQDLPVVVYLKGAVPGGAPPGYVANPSMSQRDTAFAPAALALRVGGTVRFPNADPFFHNVFSYSSAKRFDLGRYPEGESKSEVFDQPGVVEIFCEVHDFMRGVIVVTENPFHAVAGPDGSFSIVGVPPGEYTLVAWHVDHEPVERRVRVADGSNARVDVELRR